jgi:hypothetical protein
MQAHRLPLVLTLNRHKEEHFAAMQRTAPSFGFMC